MCQGFSHSVGCLHHFVLAKLTTTSIRVKTDSSSSLFQCINRWVYGEERTCPTCRQHALLPEDFPRLGSK